MEFPIFNSVGNMAGMVDATLLRELFLQRLPTNVRVLSWQQI